MSRSSTRGPQRRPPRRPKVRSIDFSLASRSGGSRSVSTIAAALAKPRPAGPRAGVAWHEDRRSRSEEHTSELQSLMRISYAVFCMKKKNHKNNIKSRKHNNTYDNAHNT